MHNKKNPADIKEKTQHKSSPDRFSPLQEFSRQKKLFEFWGEAGNYEIPSLKTNIGPEDGKLEGPVETNINRRLKLT